MIIDALKTIVEEMKLYLKTPNVLVRTSYPYFEISSKELPQLPIVILSLFAIEPSPYYLLQERYKLEPNKIYYLKKLDVVKATFNCNMICKTFSEGYKSMIDVVHMRKSLLQIKVGERILPVYISYPTAISGRTEVFGLTFSLSIDNLLVYNLEVQEINLILKREFEFEERNSESKEIVQDK